MRFLAIARILTHMQVQIQIVRFRIARCIFWTKMHAIRGLAVLKKNLLIAHFCFLCVHLFSYSLIFAYSLLNDLAPSL